MTQPGDSAATVPLDRPDVSYGTFRATFPVRARALSEIGSAYNWAVGRMTAQAPAYHVDVTMSAGSTYKIGLSSSGEEYESFRAYHLDAVGDGRYSVHVEHDSVSASNAPVSTFQALQSTDQPFYARHLDFRKYSTGVSKEDLVVAPTGGNIRLRTLHMYTMPVSRIYAGFNTTGVPLSSIAKGQPIDEDTARGWYWIWTHTSNLLDRNRGHFQWAVPYDKDGSTTTDFAISTASTSFTNAFALGIPVLAVQPGTNSGTTNGQVLMRALVWAESGGSGQVRLKSDATGDTITFSISQTQPTWVGTSARCDHPCEDTSTADGLQGGSFDTGQVQLRTTTTGKAVYMSTVRIYDRF